MKNTLARAAAVAAGFALPIMASAQDYYDDYDYYYDDYYSTGGSDAAGWVVLLIMGVVGLISLVFTVFWVWMLIDAFKREFENKTLWIVLFFVFGGWTALAYFFMIKRKNVTGVAAPAAPATAAPAVPQEPAQPAAPTGDQQPPAQPKQ